jgi:hypothetical protein
MSHEKLMVEQTSFHPASAIATILLLLGLIGGCLWIYLEGGAAKKAAESTSASESVPADR